MSQVTPIAPLGQIVLARLLVSGAKGATAAELKKALDPLAGHRWPGAELAAGLDQTLAELEAAGLTIRTKKGKTARATLSPEGQKRALLELGLDALPPKTTWGKLTKTFLAARALGLPAPQGEDAKRFVTENGFKGTLLKTEFSLAVSTYPKFEAAIEALAWKLLGIPPGRKFSVQAVQAALIQRALEELREADPKPDPKKEATKLLARKTAARSSVKDDLRLAVIRRWVGAETSDAPEAVSQQAEAAPLQAEGPSESFRLFPPGAEDGAAAAAPVALGTFARGVLEAARAARIGRFGDRKVFIYHVWKALVHERGFEGMNLEAFKRRLVEANQTRLLDLARADLVEAMNPDDVRLSETSHLGATFHFVRI